MAITLFETFRAIFYAPFYAAHALEAYREEGIDVRLETASNPAATASGLLSGETDVSWGGPMRILLTHDHDPGCGLVGFCEVVTRDPFFVVGRAPRPDFQMSDLEGLRIATVSEAVELYHLESQSQGQQGQQSNTSLYNCWLQTQRWGSAIDDLMAQFR